VAKSPAITAFLDDFSKEMFGTARTEALTLNTCVFCQGQADSFDDALSKKEYGISGMCQTCQDSIFGEPED
jgi:hypothetical protein